MNQRKPEGACVCAISASLAPLLHNPPHGALTAFLLLYHRNPRRRPPAGAPGTPPDCPDRFSPATTSQDRNIQCRPGHQTLRENQLEIDLAEKMEIFRRRSDADYLTYLENQGEEIFFCALPLFHIFGSFQGIPFIFSEASANQVGIPLYSQHRIRLRNPI